MNSWSYSGNDGRIQANEKDESYSDKFEEGDVVGCGITSEGGIFFTRGGKHLGDSPHYMRNEVHALTLTPTLGVAWKNVYPCRVFPVVAIQTRGGHIRANFEVPDSDIPQYSTDGETSDDSDSEESG